jgi:hypothetical protein
LDPGRIEPKTWFGFGVGAEKNPTGRFGLDLIKFGPVVEMLYVAMNDTQCPEGLVPSLLVIGVLPRFPGSNT